MDKELIKYLDNFNIKYKIYEHTPVFTVAESNLLKLNLNCLHTKNLFLRDEKKRFYLVCLPAEKRLNIKVLKEKLEVKELKFGSEEELKEELSVFPGSVSLFAMIHSKKTKLLLDKDIWATKKVGFHPNINTATLSISHSGLEKFYNSLKCQKEIIELE